MVLVLCLMVSFRTFGASSTVRDYRVTKCTVTYSDSIGQLRINWNETQRSTSFSLVLFQDDIEVESFSGCTGMSLDITEYIKDTGTLSAEIYPEKIGPEYTVYSNRLDVTEKMLEKIREYDPSLYQFFDAGFVYDSQKGNVTGTWNYTDVNSSAMVKLYRGSAAVTGWLDSLPSVYDFTDVIAKKGTGKYTFRVYPGRLGDCYAITSDELEVDSQMLKGLKTTVTAAKKAEEEKKTGWYHDGPTNIWLYYKQPGVQAKKEWITYKGKSYHFSSGGIMQIGWQVIDSKYYYFDETGALATDCTTPDGYQVNQNGERVDDTGNAVSAKGEREAPAVPAVLDSCTVGVSETSRVDPGVIRHVDFKDGTGFHIEQTVISIPYESWTPGVPVTVKLIVTAGTNYSFGNKISFSVRGCRNIVSTGDSKKRTVLFSYIPKTQLQTPDHIYMTSQNDLCWKKVDKAKRYKVVVCRDGEQILSRTLEENRLNMDGYYSSDGDETVSVKLYAMAGTQAVSYYQTSAVALIENLKEYASSNYVVGNLLWTDKGLRYTDENGDKVTGWKNIFGNWYLFKSNGYAAGPGWAQDKDELWYYFDNEYRMCTGWINDGVKDYWLNDGSVTNLPLGAWVRNREK